MTSRQSQYSLSATPRNSGWYLAIATLSVLTVSLPASSHGEPAPTTRKAFLEESKTTVQQRYGLRELDLDNPFDKAAREELTYIDQSFMKYHFPTELFWTNAEGSRAHPDAGIAINRKELSALIRKYGDAWKALIYTFTLAHEKAHMIQFKEYGLTRTINYPTRVVEAQADILAGAYIILRPNFFNAPSLTTLSNLARDIGALTPDWEDHPTPQQRDEALAQGAQFQSTFIEWQSGAITESQFRQKVNLRSGEDFLAWSLRRAAFLAGVPDKCLQTPEDADCSSTASADFANALTKVLASMPDDFRSITGASLGDRESGETYASMVKLPNTQSTVIVVPEDKTNSYLGCVVARRIPRADAEVRFQSTAALVLGTLPAEWRGIPESPTQGVLRALTWRNDALGATVTLTLTHGGHGYEVALYVTKEATAAGH